MEEIVLKTATEVKEEVATIELNVENMGLLDLLAELGGVTGGK